MPIQPHPASPASDALPAEAVTIAVRYCRKRAPVVAFISVTLDAMPNRWAIIATARHGEDDAHLGYLVRVDGLWSLVTSPAAQTWTAEELLEIVCAMNILNAARTADPLDAFAPSTPSR